MDGIVAEAHRLEWVRHPGDPSLLHDLAARVPDGIEAEVLAVVGGQAIALHAHGVDHELVGPPVVVEPVDQDAAESILQKASRRAGWARSLVGLASKPAKTAQ